MSYNRILLSETSRVFRDFLISFFKRLLSFYIHPSSTTQKSDTERYAVTLQLLRGKLHSKVDTAENRRELDLDSSLESAYCYYIALPRIKFKPTYVITLPDLGYVQVGCNPDLAGHHEFLSKRIFHTGQLCHILARGKLYPLQKAKFRNVKAIRTNRILVRETSKPHRVLSNSLQGLVKNHI